jgi:hypothetical protein
MLHAKSLVYRGVSAAGVFLVFLSTWLLLFLFPGGGLDPVLSWHAVRDRPDLGCLFAIGVTIIAWTVLSLAGGVVMRGVALDLAGRPASLPELLRFARHHWFGLAGATPATLAASAVMALFAGVLLLLVRVPLAGWLLLLVVLLPVVVFAWGAVRIVLTWLVAGHLAAAGVAVEGPGTYPAIARPGVWFRRDPTGLVVARLCGIGVGIGHALWSIAFAAGAGLLLWHLAGFFAGGVRAGVETTLREGFGAVSLHADVGAAVAGLIGIVFLAWLASAPLVCLFGGRVALYLGHREALDGTPVDAPDPKRVRQKDLDEQGVELVRQIREEFGPEED